ncbi:MAG: phosphate ABC transporter permease PstA [Chloroflexi bacterium]|nr:phosphate ABC transporter permease PstA [Chloroflexota bacterium]
MSKLENKEPFPNVQGTGVYPEGDGLQAQIQTRHRWGFIWRIVFILALMIAIVSLVSLLYTIVNDAFGYVAIINKVDPERLTLNVLQNNMLSAPNTTSSEDDHVLAAGISDNPDGIGFFGYAYYQENADDLQIVSVDGQEAGGVAEDYPLVRPLYLYSSASVLEENQAANLFLNYLLTNIGDQMDEIGYLPTSAAGQATAQQNWLRANPTLGLSPGQWAAINPEGVDGRVSITGSSTVFPLTEHMLAQFQAAGFAGTYDNTAVGSSAGITAFCAGEVDIAASSRPIKSGEFEVCRKNGRFPLEFQVGIDTLAVVVNLENNFATDLSTEQLQTIFTTAETWADVNPAWPDRPIYRFVPGSDSGTLDFFIETVFETTLADLPKDDLVQILAANITTGRGRTIEREQRFYENALVFESPELWNEVCAAPANERPSGCTAPVRSQDDVYDLLIREVVQEDVVKTYKLVDSIFRRSEIAAEVAQQYPNGVLQFRSWLTTDFVRDSQSSTPEYAGVRTAILGSLWVIAITILFSFPIGTGAAIYLEEYASDNKLNRLLQTNINNLAGVPSIIYGMLGLAVFVRTFEILTSGAFFGAVDSGATANGRTILSAGLTLGLLILPIIIINSQEALRAVPNSLRQAGLALGATRWQTIWSHVLPNALPGILTGTILAVSRALGETAPLVVVGASTFITVDPSGPFSKFTTLPIQIYQWTSRPQAEFRNIAAAAIVVLLALLLTLNATAVLLRNRYSNRMG